MCETSQFMLHMASTWRLGLVLEDGSQDGVRVSKVEDFAVIEGTPIHKGDFILKINGADAKRDWGTLLKRGAPNSPFQLQFWSHANKKVSSCVIYKQIVDAFSAKTSQPAATNPVSCF